MKSNDKVWDLSRLYKDFSDRTIQSDILRVQELKNSLITDYKGKIEKGGLTSAALARSLETVETLLDTLARLSLFSFLNFSITPNEPSVQKFLQRISELEASTQSELIFLRIELSGLADTDFDRLASSRELSNYRHFLGRIRETRKYLLSEPEEKIVSLKDLTGKKAMIKLYDEYTSQFEYEIELEGEKKSLSESELSSLRTDNDPEKRKKAFLGLFDKVEENSLVLTNIYNSLVKDWDSEAKKRGYASPISVRNVENETDDKSVQALIEATSDGYALVREYYKLKAKLMGKPKLLHSDIYAPVGETKVTFNWPQARETILDVMNDFEPRVGSIVKTFFEEAYIHADLLPGKRSGAFCAYAVPGVHPYVLVNYSGKIEDVMTLAHELGHGLHGYLSSKQTALNYNTPLTMAETASVFSEMLMTDYLLENMGEKTDKIAFLSHRIEEMFATTARQNMFTRFELRAHEKISSEYASFEELSELYRSELEKMFADSVEFFPQSEYEWGRIPHIYHTPFYCYAYNFAQLLVISLYRKYLEDGNRFKVKYIQLLESAGSESPEKLLSRLGVDIKDPAFWQKGLSFIKERFIDVLEKLIREE